MTQKIEPGRICCPECAKKGVTVPMWIHAYGWSGRNPIIVYQCHRCGKTVGKRVDGHTRDIDDKHVRIDG